MRTWLKSTGLDRRGDANLLLLRSWSGNARGPGQLQQVHKQRVQGRSDSLLGELVHEYVCRLCDLFGRWVHGSRTTEASGGSGRFRTGSRFLGLPLGGASVARSTSLVLSIFLHVAAHRSWLAVLYHGGIHYSYGDFAILNETLFWQNNDFELLNSWELWIVCRWTNGLYCSAVARNYS